MARIAVESSLLATIHTVPPRCTQASTSKLTPAPRTIGNSRRLARRAEGGMPGVRHAAGVAPTSSPGAAHPDFGRPGSHCSILPTPCRSNAMAAADTSDDGRERFGSGGKLHHHTQTRSPPAHARGLSVLPGPVVVLRRRRAPANWLVVSRCHAGHTVPAAAAGRAGAKSSRPRDDDGSADGRSRD